jgi:MFS family permease
VTQRLSFRRLVGTGIGTKLLNDTGIQIFNPFLPVIASGLGIEVVTLGRLVGLQRFMGLAAPIGGVVGDRRSYRTVVVGSLVVEAVGFGLVGLSDGQGFGRAVLVAGMVVSGLGMAWFVPALQAYSSSQLPYDRRARGMGMIEYAWALTGIVTLFLAGRLIEATTWRAPFLVLAALMLVAAAVFAGMPAEPRPHGHGDSGVVAARALTDSVGGLALDEVVHDLERHPGAPAPTGPPVTVRATAVDRLIGFFRLGPGAGSAYAEIVAGALLYFAAFQVLLVHGIWLQDDFGVTAAGLGTVALVFGVFDLAASVSVSLFVDRIGKRRSVLAGMAAGVVAYLLIPMLDRGVVAAVVGLTVARCVFEFTIVSHFPLLSEQIPTQRGKVLTLGTSSGLLCSTGAGFVGPWLFERAGIVGVGVLSAVTMAAAALLVALFVKEPAS